MAVAGSLFAANQAEAAIVNLAPVAGTPVPTTLTDWADHISFPKFNGSLGTLTGVTIIINTTFDTDFSVHNAAGAGTASGNIVTKLSVKLDSGGGLSTVISVLGPEFDYTPLGENATKTSGILTKSASSGPIDVNPSNFALYIGAGAIDVPVGTHTSTLLDNSGGNFTYSQSTHASATGTISYSYTAVPEPSTYLAGLGAFGILGVFGLRSRR